MSRNYYSEIHLHVTWHTRLSSPLLTARIGPLAHRELRQKVMAYVRNQKEHHARGTVHERLERITAPDGGDQAQAEQREAR